MNVDHDRLTTFAEEAQQRQENYTDKECASYAYWAGVEDGIRFALGTIPQPKGL